MFGTILQNRDFQDYDKKCDIWLNDILYLEDVSANDNIPTMRFLKRDDMHKWKFDMTGELYVINVGDYFESRTRLEIVYVWVTGKTVLYLEEIRWVYWSDVIA